MKKIFTLFLALVATTALWAEDFEVDGIYYNILTDKTNEVEVTFRGSDYDSYSNEYSGSVTIPSTVTYNGITYSVTSIGYSAFDGCSSLTSITIPNSVTSIGGSAFYECTSLTSITIPNSVTSIGEKAFYECYGLKSITIPNSVTSIGESAFESCSGLTSITIPNSVTSIGERAFFECSGLTSVTIGNSVTSIGELAFAWCSGLTSINIPNSVTSIGNFAFRFCSGLTSPVYNAHCFAYMPTSYRGAYAIPEGIKQIVGGAFCDCTGLTSITIPNSVTSIGEKAFWGCSGLTSITIPNSVTSIGDYAFAWCSGLTSITIPNSVTSIGDGAFYHCYALTSVTIPNRVTSIGSEAFAWCSRLTSVTIPNSVTSIGNSAFYWCDGLTSVNVFAEVPPTLGTDAFYNVSTTIPVYVPCGSVSAYQSAEGWKAFTNIQVPLAEYSIAVGVNDNKMGTAKVDENTICGAQISATANYRYRFVQWSDGNTDNPRTLVLTQDTVLTAEFAFALEGQCGDNLYWSYDETTKTISITGSGKMYDYTVNTQPWILFKEDIKEVTTSNITTSIGISAFEGCVRLTKVSLGSGMVNIAANAFAECKKLYDIYSYAEDPPTANESSFANYNAYLYIPCESQRYYKADLVFSKFYNQECISSDKVDTEAGTVVVEPSTNSVTITWPTEEKADTYTIEIKKDGVLFCTLTFNADGQLLNIAFAPSRSGSHPVTYAASTGNGLRFTVTSLEESTTYGYDITTKDEKDTPLSTYTGEFTTKSNVSTSVSDIQSPMTDCQKLLRNGQLVIVRDGVEYNAQGQIIKE